MADLSSKRRVLWLFEPGSPFGSAPAAPPLPPLAPSLPKANSLPSAYLKVHPPPVAGRDCALRAPHSWHCPTSLGVKSHPHPCQPPSSPFPNLFTSPSFPHCHRLSPLQTQNLSSVPRRPRPYHPCRTPVCLPGPPNSRPPDGGSEPQCIILSPGCLPLAKSSSSRQAHPQAPAPWLARSPGSALTDRGFPPPCPAPAQGTCSISPRAAPSGDDFLFPASGAGTVPASLPTPQWGPVDDREAT